MGLVIFDRQHVGNPQNNFKSVGAANDTDNSGLIDIEEMEGILTAKYIYEAEKILRRRGHDVIVISDGTYFDRHLRVNEYRHKYPGNDIIYFACHINAGGGEYSAFFWDHRSSSGKRLADCLVTAFEEGFVGGCRALPCHTQNWTKNAYYCIKDVSPVAICLEPYFIDCKKHDIYKTTLGCENLAVWIANGVEMFWEGK